MNAPVWNPRSCRSSGKSLTSAGTTASVVTAWCSQGKSEESKVATLGLVQFSWVWAELKTALPRATSSSSPGVRTRVFALKGLRWSARRVSIR
ncbi:MAG: hypothetical protein QM778_33870 [Myxococcales bacterium]